MTNESNINFKMYNQTPPFSDPGQSPDSKHQKVNTIWKAFALIYALAAAGLSLYWEFTDQGLAMTFREWQVALLKDSYYPLLSFLLCLIVLIIPLFPVKLIVEKMTGVKIERGKM